MIDFDLDIIEAEFVLKYSEQFIALGLSMQHANELCKDIYQAIAKAKKVAWNFRNRYGEPEV